MPTVDDLVKNVFGDKKTSKKRYHEREDKVDRKTYQRGKTFIVNVVPEDKLRIRAFAGAERNLFNLLVERFSSQVRTNPDMILTLKNDWAKLFSALAIHGISSSVLISAIKGNALPEALSAFKTLVESRDKNKQPVLTQDMIVFMDGMDKHPHVHKEIRKNIVETMIEFYKIQAERYKEGRDSDEDVYKTAPETLEQVNDMQKRHLQVPRTLLQIKYVEAEDKTEIRGPYWVSPLIIDGTIPEGDWNLAIVHQESGSIPSLATNWVMDFKRVPVPYMLRYLDMVNPNRFSAFSAAKARSF